MTEEEQDREGLLPQDLRQIAACVRVDAANGDDYSEVHERELLAAAADWEVALQRQKELEEGIRLLLPVVAYHSDPHGHKLWGTEQYVEARNLLSTHSKGDSK